LSKAERAVFESKLIASPSLIFSRIKGGADSLRPLEYQTGNLRKQNDFRNHRGHH
jgi:hypothetical protein